MLCNTLPLAIPYAQDLADRGIQLGVPDQSDLNVLLRHSLMDSPKAYVPVNEFIQSVKDATVVEGAMTDYEGYRLALIDELEGPVKLHQRLAQEIGRVAKNLSETVQKFAEKVEDQSPAHNFVIAKDRLMPVFQQASVSMTLGQTLAVGKITFDSLVSTPRQREEIMGMLTSTGETSLDKEMQLLIDNYDHQWLENIWYAFFFRSGEGSEYNPNYMASVPPGERASVYLVVAMLASSLLQSVPKDAVGTLNQFRDKVATLRDYAYTQANATVEEFNTQVANKALVSRYRSVTGCPTIFVLEPVYNDWLDAGGRPELLLAASLQGGNIFTVDEFAVKIPALTSVWNTHCAAHTSQSASRRSQFLRSLYLSCFTESVSQVEEFEAEYRRANPKHAENCLKEAQYFLDGQSIDALCCFDQIALELTARLRFGYTAAYQILSDINRIRAENPETPVREAALVASTAYIVGYLFTQLSVHRR